MSDAAHNILQKVYGYDQFRGQQSAVIEAAVEGHNALVLMPTGGGKSLCYQIPALLRDGLGIVVSPLIALMQDQVSALQQLGINAAFLNSTLGVIEQRKVAEQIRTGTLDLLYIAPERLLQPQTLSWLQEQPISLIAIDEAHCVSQWGHDFRQDYLGLHVLRSSFPGVPRLALTATADPRTQQEIIDRLQLDEAKHFVSGFDRPNIRYSVHPKTDARRQLLQFLNGHREEAGIIYCMSRKKVDNTADWLTNHGFEALPYHAGLSGEQRADHQARFLREEAVVMVATIAFGMGIDKPDVRFVAHLDLPKSIEAYYQETGRAGRDGAPAQAWMVYGLQDVVRLQQMMDESQAEVQQKRIERHKLDALLGWCETTGCRRQALLAYFADDHPGDCGNCDSCMEPPKTWDATVPSQKLLSCVYRTGQRFGSGHIIDVLLGKTTDKIHQFGHENISTYGIGVDHTVAQWRSILRQLLVRGFLSADLERYGALTLTETSRPLLRGEMTLFLREDPVKPLKRASRKHRVSGVSEQDQTLWNSLRECRKALAESQGIAPYMIFHDATLMEMMEYRPSSDQELLQLNGVGRAKLDRYGEDFLAIIRASVAA